MGRVVLLSLLCLLTWYYLPDSRSMLLDAFSPVIEPVQRWRSEEEMAQIGRNVLEHERLTGRLPRGSEWLGWLEYRYAGRAAWIDEWGLPYQLEIREGSVVVLSYGPDRTRGTADDLRVVTQREPEPGFRGRGSG